MAISFDELIEKAQKANVSKSDDMILSGLKSSIDRLIDKIDILVNRPINPNVQEYPVLQEQKKIYEDMRSLLLKVDKGSYDSNDTETLKSLLIEEQKTVSTLRKVTQNNAQEQESLKKAGHLNTHSDDLLESLKKTVSMPVDAITKLAKQTGAKDYAKDNAVAAGGPMATFADEIWKSGIVQNMYSKVRDFMNVGNDEKKPKEQSKDERVNEALKDIERTIGTKVEKSALAEKTEGMMKSQSPTGELSAEQKEFLQSLRNPLETAVLELKKLNEDSTLYKAGLAELTVSTREIKNAIVDNPTQLKTDGDRRDEEKQEAQELKEILTEMKDADAERFKQEQQDRKIDDIRRETDNVREAAAEVKEKAAESQDGEEKKEEAKVTLIDDDTRRNASLDPKNGVDTFSSDPITDQGEETQKENFDYNKLFSLFGKGEEKTEGGAATSSENGDSWLSRAADAAHIASFLKKGRLGRMISGGLKGATGLMGLLAAAGLASYVLDETTWSSEGLRAESERSKIKPGGSLTKAANPIFDEESLNLIESANENYDVSDIMPGMGAYSQIMGSLESKGNQYDNVNQIGYIGKYQMGIEAFKDAWGSKSPFTEKALEDLKSKRRGQLEIANDPTSYKDGWSLDRIKEDKSFQEESMLRYSYKNFQYLIKLLGREPTYDELALAHNQGAGNAAKTIKALEKKERGIELTDEEQKAIDFTDDNNVNYERYKQNVDINALSMISRPHDHLSQKGSSVTDAQVIMSSSDPMLKLDEYLEGYNDYDKARLLDSQITILESGAAELKPGGGIFDKRDPELQSKYLALVKRKRDELVNANNFTDLTSVDNSTKTENKEVEGDEDKVLKPKSLTEEQKSKLLSKSESPVIVEPTTTLDKPIDVDTEIARLTSQDGFKHLALEDKAAYTSNASIIPSGLTDIVKNLYNKLTNNGTDKRKYGEGSEYGEKTIDEKLVFSQIYAKAIRGENIPGLTDEENKKVREEIKKSISSGENAAFYKAVGDPNVLNVEMPGMRTVDENGNVQGVRDGYGGSFKYTEPQQEHSSTSSSSNPPTELANMPTIEKDPEIDDNLEIVDAYIAPHFGGLQSYANEDGGFGVQNTNLYVAPKFDSRNQNAFNRAKTREYKKRLREAEFEKKYGVAKGKGLIDTPIENSVNATATIESEFNKKLDRFDPALKEVDAKPEVKLTLPTRAQDKRFEVEEIGIASSDEYVHEKVKAMVPKPTLQKIEKQTEDFMKSIEKGPTEQAKPVFSSNNQIVYVATDYNDKGTLKNIG